MATHPILPLYVDDYDAATAHLTPAEDGIYMRLLRLAWRTPGCSLPDDPAWIARKIRLNTDEFLAVAKPVLDEFFQVVRGRLVQRRLRAEYDSISRRKSARAEAGKKGGNAKALKTKGNAPSNANIRKDNASVLPAYARASPSPSPSPIKETPKVPAGAEPELVLADCDFEQPISNTKRSTLNGHQAEFDRWYAAFPRHEGRGAAERAFPAALRLADIEILVERAGDYAVAMRGVERRFVKQPATWLNQKCWLDEREKASPREEVF